MEKSILLEMKGVSKAFPGVKALDDMRLTVKRGSVHALMGENGAGKSTLMKILIGMYKADAGEIFLDGEPLDTSDIRKVMGQGISMIHQELNPLDNMSVAENIFCGQEPVIGRSQIVDFRTMKNEARKLLDRLEIQIDVSEMESNLSVAQKQLVEIAKALSFGAKLIIMDEPTSAITEAECAQLFNIIDRLKKQGMSFIYITHKMDEVFRVSDEITVMRDGRYVATCQTGDTDHNELVKLMVGRDITDIFPKEQVEIGETLLSVKNLCMGNTIRNVSFEAHRGEILGVAGLMGAGRTEIMETIFGMRRASSGEIRIKDKPVVIKKPRDAIRQGVAFLTEDRKKNGCFLCLNVYYNIMMLTWHMKLGLVDDRVSRNECNEQIRKYGVRTPTIKQTLNNLSGGNQQKVLLARWLHAAPDIIILDEPTRGIDVGSKHEIYNEMNKLVKAGKTIIMISSEMPEILGMSDRIMVIHDGEIAGILDREEADQETILTYAAGLTGTTKKG